MTKTNPISICCSRTRVAGDKTVFWSDSKENPLTSAPRDSTASRPRPPPPPPVQTRSAKLTRTPTYCLPLARPSHKRERCSLSITILHTRDGWVFGGGVLQSGKRFNFPIGKRERVTVGCLKCRSASWCSTGWMGFLKRIQQRLNYTQSGRLPLNRSPQNSSMFHLSAAGFIFFLFLGSLMLVDINAALSLETACDYTGGKAPLLLQSGSNGKYMNIFPAAHCACVVGSP